MPVVEKVRPSTNKLAEIIILRHGELLKTFPVKSFESREAARQWVNQQVAQDRSVTL